MQTGPAVFNEMAKNNSRARANFNDSNLTQIIKSLELCLKTLLSRTQAGMGITVKLEEEEISRNHVQTF